MQIRTIVSLLLIAIIAQVSFGISSEEAIAIVSVRNNYLLTGEIASAAKEMISYKGDSYVIIAAKSNENINCYIPIKNSTGEIASSDLEIRDLIKAAIVYTKMTSLSASKTSSSWPFTHYTKNYYYDLSNDFGSLKNSLLTVRTELNKINSTQAESLVASAGDLIDLSDELAQRSVSLTKNLEQYRLFELEFFNSPDTNEITKYENTYTTYFLEISDMKDLFTELNKEISELSQGIGSLESGELGVDQKRSLINLLQIPINARKLPTIFSENEQLRTEVETIFNESKNSENYATTLINRKKRNEAWKIMYGQNSEMIKVDPSFDTLQKAATSILAEENIEAWKNQEAVAALKTNWDGAVSRYNNVEYDKAKEYALKAERNVKDIMGEGFIQNQINDNSLITMAIIGLVALIIIIFVLQNFVLKKKKKEEDNEQNYN